MYIKPYIITNNHVPVYIVMYTKNITSNIYVF